MIDFDQYVEYVTEGPIVHSVPLDVHALDSALTLQAVAGGYQHAAQLGRTYTLAPDELDTVRATVLASYHQDVADNEVASDDPAEIARRLAWVLAHPQWHLGASVSPPDANGDGGVYFYPGDGNLYRCVQAHTVDDPNWTPPDTPALWTRFYVEAWPEWVQPTGAHDAYNTGDKVTFNGQHYVSLIDANVWSPAVFPAGWQLQA